jgi:hypothetical protein
VDVLVSASPVSLAALAVSDVLTVLDALTVSVAVDVADVVDVAGAVAVDAVAEADAAADDDSIKWINKEINLKNRLPLQEFVQGLSF